MLPYLSLLLPTFVGGLIGFLSARLMAAYQAARQRRNIAQGILLELGRLEKPLTGWANILRNPPGGGQVRIDTPLYPSDGLYHSLKKDMLQFNHELAGELFAFYIGLMNVEQERRTPTDSPAYPIMMKGVAKGLSESVERLPHLRALLLKEVERSARPRLAGRAKRLQEGD
jgi:hypothetical protein